MRYKERITNTGSLRLFFVCEAWSVAGASAQDENCGVPHLQCEAGSKIFQNSIQVGVPDPFRSTLIFRIQNVFHPDWSPYLIPSWWVFRFSFYHSFWYRYLVIRFSVLYCTYRTYLTEGLYVISLILKDQCQQECLLSPMDCLFLYYRMYRFCTWYGNKNVYPT